MQHPPLITNTESQTIASLSADRPPHQTLRTIYMSLHSSLLKLASDNSTSTSELWLTYLLCVTGFVVAPVIAPPGALDTLRSFSAIAATHTGSRSKGQTWGAKVETPGASICATKPRHLGRRRAKRQQSCPAASPPNFNPPRSLSIARISGGFGGLSTIFWVFVCSVDSPRSWSLSHI